MYQKKSKRPIIGNVCVCVGLVQGEGLYSSRQLIFLGVVPKEDSQCPNKVLLAIQIVIIQLQLVQPNEFQLATGGLVGLDQVIGQLLFSQLQGLQVLISLPRLDPPQLKLVTYYYQLASGSEVQTGSQLFTFPLRSSLEQRNTCISASQPLCLVFLVYVQVFYFIFIVCYQMNNFIIWRLVGYKMIVIQCFHSKCSVFISNSIWLLAYFNLDSCNIMHTTNG